MTRHSTPKADPAKDSDALRLGANHHALNFPRLNSLSLPSV